MQNIVTLVTTKRLTAGDTSHVTSPPFCQLPEGRTYGVNTVPCAVPCTVPCTVPCFMSGTGMCGPTYGV